MDEGEELLHYNIVVKLLKHDLLHNVTLRCVTVCTIWSSSSRWMMWARRSPSASQQWSPPPRFREQTCSRGPEPGTWRPREDPRTASSAHPRFPWKLFDRSRTIFFVNFDPTPYLWFSIAHQKHSALENKQHLKNILNIQFILKREILYQHS